MPFWMQTEDPEYNTDDWDTWSDIDDWNDWDTWSDADEDPISNSDTSVRNG